MKTGAKSSSETLGSERWPRWGWGLGLTLTAHCGFRSQPCRTLKLRAELRALSEPRSDPGRSADPDELAAGGQGGLPNAKVNARPPLPRSPDANPTGVLCCILLAGVPVLVFELVHPVFELRIFRPVGGSDVLACSGKPSFGPQRGGSLLCRRWK